MLSQSGGRDDIPADDWRSSCGAKRQRKKGLSCDRSVVNHVFDAYSSPVGTVDRSQKSNSCCAAALELTSARQRAAGVKVERTTANAAAAASEACRPS